MAEPIAMCFSGGKDSALALAEIRQQRAFDVVSLVTTVTDTYDRVSMHGVRRTLLRQQAEAIGLPLMEVVVPPQSSNDIYEQAMGAAFRRLRADGIQRIAFGDIFLEDLRAYRERHLAASDLRGLYPLWKRDTSHLARRFIRERFAATAVCVNPSVLDASFAGRTFDRAFLTALPPAVDPCGENGEFHTFVSDGPIFRHPVPIAIGAVVERDGFVFCDLVPASRTGGDP